MITAKTARKRAIANSDKVHTSIKSIEECLEATINSGAVNNSCFVSAKKAKKAAKKFEDMGFEVFLTETSEGDFLFEFEFFDA